jgi:transporter family-2 protein
MIAAAVISIIAGASVVLARNINSSLANKLGLLEGTFFNYVVGLLFSLIFLLLSGEFLGISSGFLNSVPLWAYLGGLVGVMVVSLSNVVTPKISAFYLTLIMFVGQLFTGIIIDYFALNLVSAGKLIGGLLVVLGLISNLLVDKKSETVKTM